MNLEGCRRVPWPIYRTYPRISWDALMKNATFSFNIQPSSGNMKLAQ